MLGASAAAAVAELEEAPVSLDLLVVAEDAANHLDIEDLLCLAGAAAEEVAGSMGTLEGAADGAPATAVAVVVDATDGAAGTLLLPAT